jgi:hypothetical protein
VAHLFRIFISSTFADLKDYRQAAYEAIQGLDFHADDMLFWSADERSGSTNSLERVKQSDVVILLLAHRYGYVPDGSLYSVTELEYRTARESAIPVLAFVLDESVPWPPEHVEWEARDRLRAFKELVDREVTRKVFKTPDDLATQVTQALALFLSRQTQVAEPRELFQGYVPQVSLAGRVTSDPDLLVHLGAAEDRLPLLLDIRRSRDLSGIFDQLADAIGAPARPAPIALLQTFQQSLEQYATEKWASEQILPVRLLSGQLRELYISPFTLSGPFNSMLASILDGAAEGLPDRSSRVAVSAQAAFLTQGSRPRWRSLRSGITGPSVASPMWELQSTGGANRFLGISPEDGAVYSVGRTSDGLVEWRPFIFEDAKAAFAGAQFNLKVGGRSFHYPLADALTILPGVLAQESRDEFGRFDAVGRVQVPRQSILMMLVSIASQLAKKHASGCLHADVKPHNVLLLAEGAVLIDSFDVTPGNPSPGWTAEWSAPEQVLGLPLSPVADIYPLARMVGRLLGGQVVGEVRRYRAPRKIAGSDSLELVHDPSLFLEPQPHMDEKGRSRWRQFVEGGLRFDPERREPGSAEEFATILEEIGREFPLAGGGVFEPAGKLMAARLVDGTYGVARGLFSSDPRMDVEGRRHQATAAPPWRDVW